jgi:hypothetical protein
MYLFALTSLPTFIYAYISFWNFRTFSKQKKIQQKPARSKLVNLYFHWGERFFDLRYILYICIRHVLFTKIFGKGGIEITDP